MTSTMADSRMVRKKFLELKEAAINRQDDPEYLIENLETSDKLSECITKPREAKLDSEHIHTQSTILKNQANALDTNFESFVPATFVKKLLEHYQAGLANPEHAKKIIWTKLAAEAPKLLPDTPAFHYIFGSFEPGVVEHVKKERKKRKLDDDSKVQKAKIVDEAGEEDLTKDNARRILSILKLLYEKQGPLCYFSFVVNPTSFSETIENMFYVSILVKEAAVVIYRDADGLPALEPVAKEDKPGLRHRNNLHQFVISIDMDEWREIVEEFHIVQPMIPPRSTKT